MKKYFVLVLIGLASSLSFAEWTYVENIDLFTDENTSYIYSDATQKRGISFGDVTLILRCNSGEYELYVKWSEYLGSDEEHPVRMRFDKEEPSDWMKWFPSTTGTASFAPPTITMKMIELMKAKNTLVLGTEDYQKSPYQAAFSLTGFTANFNQLNCN